MPLSPDTDGAHRQGWRRVGPRLLLSVAGIGLFVAVIYLAGSDRVDAIFDADLGWIAVAFASGFAVTVVSAFRWGYITNAVAGRRALRWRQYWASLLTSRVLGLFVPRNASDLGVRFVALTGVGATSPEVAATSVALDQLFDMALLAAWLAPSLFLLASGGDGWLLWFVPVSGIVALWLMLRLGVAASWFAGALSKLAGRLGRRHGKVGRFFLRRSDGFERLTGVQHLTPSQSLVIAAATFGRYGLNSLMFWAVAQSLGLSIELWTLVLAGAAVQLSLVVAFTPGGLGIMDLGWVGVLALGGVPSEIVAAFIVGQRAFQYTFFPIAAAVSYLITAGREREPDPRHLEPSGA